ncbi:EmrB/QacA subfamily drug resistance transporter [Actinomycetospora succinea]|uniref:EmrB/QacA subfamily drug resistance transporter n=1 Tax=Actinomycetospora succinea TaxID=663603 RepID=A0A4R6VKP5_9PSEU|nr:EmrB/QacA subfamily drug resistance transporter [Actinomycetospora succinea]
MSVTSTRAPAFVPVLALAGITVSLQQTLVVPLVPQFPRLLGAAPADTAWIVTATLLTAAVAVPIVGRLADMVGKRRMLLVCLAMLIAGSVVAALSTSLVPLIVGRALQGLATGVIPLGISLMRDELPPERLGSATALMSASLGVGGALGLPLAALIAQTADWHVLFWAAGGLGVVVLVGVLALVPESTQRAGGRFDLVGAVGLAIALVSLLLAVSKGGTWGWGSATTVTLFVVAAVVLLLWAWWELRTRQPLVDLRVSRRRQVLLTNTASIVMGFSMFAMSLVYPQLLQLPTSTGYGLGQSILVAGLVLAPGGLCMMAMSPVSARISAASGPRTTLMIGAFVVAVGYGVGAVFHGSVWELVISSIVIACGIGLGYGAMPSLIMAAVPVEQTAAANSLNNLMRALGTSFASAVAGVLLASLVTAAGVPTEGAFVLVMVLGAGAAVVAVAIVAAIPPQRPVPRRTERTGTAEAVAAEPEPVAAPALVRGVVRHRDAPAGGAVLTVVSTDGHQLGTVRAGEDGTFAVPRTGTGRAHLLVVQWSGIAQAEPLGGTDGVERDVDLPGDAGRDRGGRGAPAPSLTV